MSRIKAQLSRERIAAAALAIADAEGFEAVSMRRVAQELNVGTMRFTITSRPRTI
jgi:AcrR family transcriptional regulator